MWRFPRAGLADLAVPSKKNLADLAAPLADLADVADLAAGSKIVNAPYETEVGGFGGFDGSGGRP